MSQSKYFVIERHTDAGYMDCWQGGEEMSHVGHHYGAVDCRRPFEPSAGSLFASEHQAAMMAAELNSSGGEGATAPHGRYIVARYRAEPAVRSFEIRAFSHDRPDGYLLYISTEADEDHARPARFVSADQAKIVARSLEEIETKGRTFTVAPSSSDAPHFVGRFVRAV